MLGRLLLLGQLLLQLRHLLLLAGGLGLQLPFQHLLVGREGGGVRATLGEPKGPPRAAGLTGDSSGSGELQVPMDIP